MTQHRAAHAVRGPALEPLRHRGARLHDPRRGLARGEPARPRARGRRRRTTGEHRPGHGGAARSDPRRARPRSWPRSPGSSGRSACSRAASTTCATRRPCPSPSSPPPSGPSTVTSSRRTRSGCSPRCWSPRTGASSTPSSRAGCAASWRPASSSRPSCWRWPTSPSSTGSSRRPTRTATWSWPSRPSRCPPDPVDRAWYTELERISGVAADIGGVTSTHINHLTPRVLDIDDLYVSMQARGIEMIDEIQGPPRWDGPDVLLRQTSFRALPSHARSGAADGEVSTGSLRVRFGEVEARGIALTPAGRDRYDELVAAVDRRLAEDPDLRRADVAPEVWERGTARHRARPLPGRTRVLHLSSVAPSVVRRAPRRRSRPPHWREGTPTRSVRPGVLQPEPIVYEDFLPRSAAGIFASNLADGGNRGRGPGRSRA